MKLSKFSYLLALSLALPASAASVIVNGDFEDGIFTADQTNDNFGVPATSTTLPGWVFGANIVTAINNVNGLAGNGNASVTLLPTLGITQVGFAINPAAGAAVIPTAATVSLSQTFATLAGTSYTVAFDFGGVFLNNISDGLDLAVTASIFDGADISATGSLITSQRETRAGSAVTVANSSANTAFNTGFNATASFTFTATSDESTILFQETSDASRSANPGLDNVSVIAIPVPEPSSFALLGLGGLGLLLRRRRA